MPAPSTDDEPPDVEAAQEPEASVPEEPAAPTPSGPGDREGPSRRYPDWLKRTLIAGGVVAIVVAGALLNLGFFGSGTMPAGLRAAAQVFGVSCLGLGLLAIIVPYADQGRADGARRQ